MPVFISYSWDSELHKTWVKTLAKRLRKDGVDVKLDCWSAVPGSQLPAFMEESIRDNEFVLIVCTPNYKNKSDNRKGGVGYEGDIMTAEIMAEITRGGASYREALFDNYGFKNKRLRTETCGAR